MNCHIKPEETVLQVPGLARPVTLVQITDSHLTFADARASDYTRQMAVERTQCFARYPDAGTAQLLAGGLELAASLDADCLVLTGDILDFPSEQNVERLHSALEQYGRPWLFATGNHDWSRAWIDGREERLPDDLDLLSPFLDPRTGCGVREAGGVRLIAVDDTTYQVSPEQLRFFQEQTADGTPCLLFLHIPLYLPSLLGDTLRVWRSPILLGIPEEVYIEDETVIHAPLPTQTTLEFCRLAGSLPNLLGIFSGHLHFSHTDPLPSGRPQYVTAPGFEGGCRVIRVTGAMEQGTNQAVSV